jgi:16S rRNA (cytidine1402-2'-O)-methyltransferase
VLYEAPHRLARTLADLLAASGSDRRVAIARELTKLHEQVWRGTLAEAADWVAEREPPGEIVVVLDGAPPAAPPDDAALRDAVVAELAAGASARDAARSVAERLDIPRRRAYEIAITAAADPGS